jgi:hypothetical protein
VGVSSVLCAPTSPHDKSRSGEPTALLTPFQPILQSWADVHGIRPTKPAEPAVGRLEKVGLEWATFQVMRRANASLLHKAGVDKKVSADQRGHGIGVSLDVYTQSDLQQKQEALRKLEAVIIQ